MKQKLRTKRNPELHGGRIRIGIVADLPNRRYFFDGGSGRRMLSTHRSGGGRMYKPVAAYSRTRRRWKFQSAISIVTRGDRGAPPRGFQFHANRRRASLREARQTHPEAGARLLVIKMLTPAVSLPEIHRILRIFRAPQQQTRKFSVSEYLFSSFSFFFVVQYRLWKLSSIFLSKKGERVRARTFLPCPRDLFFVTRESRDDSEMHRLCKYSGCWKKVIRDS